MAPTRDMTTHINTLMRLRTTIITNTHIRILLEMGITTRRKAFPLRMRDMSMPMRIRTTHQTTTTMTMNIHIQMAKTITTP